jgi:outer membrane protein insertion porin family
MIGAYNNDIGVSPFERFQLGGDGLNNQQFGNFNGTDIISMRGYEITDLEANSVNGRTVATPIFDKFTVELRYPLSLNPNSTIYDWPLHKVVMHGKASGISTHLT